MRHGEEIALSTTVFGAVDGMSKHFSRLYRHHGFLTRSSLSFWRIFEKSLSSGKICRESK